MYRAFICRYGHQDVYALLGRNAMSEPLTPIEVALFADALSYHWHRERGASDPISDLEPNED